MPAGRRLPAKKRGNRLGFWFFRMALRGTGLRGAYGLLYPVCLHYLLFDREAVRSALPYLRRRFPEAGRLRRLGQIYRLFLSQGRQLIDRFAVLSGAVPFHFTLHGSGPCGPPDTGLVLLTAHVGNWQAALTTLGHLDRPVHLVMRPEDNAAVQRALRLGVNTGHLRVISAESHLGGVVEILNALKRGEVVSFMGDRPFDFETLPVRFLGDEARFPVGPFQIAAAAGCPMQILLCARTGYRRYRVDTSHRLAPVYKPGIPRRIQLQAWMQQYADSLEGFVRDHPFQCFLFADVWRRT